MLHKESLALLNLYLDIRNVGDSGIKKAKINEIDIIIAPKI